MLVRPPIGWFQLVLFAGILIASTITAICGYQFLTGQGESLYGFIMGAYHLVLYSMFASAIQSIQKRQTESLRMFAIPTYIMVSTHLLVLAYDALSGTPTENIFATYPVGSISQAAVAALPPALELILLKRHFKHVANLRAAD